MNVEIGDWVMRVGYPVKRVGFSATFESIGPCETYRVTEVDQFEQGIEVEGKRYWAGNFVKITSEPII